MSNLFSNNPPSGGAGNNGKDDKPLFPRPAPPTAGTTGTAGAASAAPRAPLFPPRDGQTSPFATPRPTTPPAPASFGATAPAAPGAAPRPPLFPRRDPVAPAAPSAFGAGQAPARPLTAPLPPRTPLTPPAAGSRFGQAGAAPGQASSLFNRPADANAPLFPRRDPIAPAPAGSAFGTSGGAGSAFGGTGQNTSLFTTTQPAAAKPVFGASPAGSAVGGGRENKILDEEFILIRDFLYQQSGIYIAENRKYLVENRLSSRLRELGLRSFGEYYKYLRYDANRGTEMNKLFESMTTNETSFFRNQPQLDVFRDKVLSKVLAELRAKGQKKLRIWSAGCSSGEEPYTLAIIITEVLKQELSSWDIKITANDLSLAMLTAARRGLYNDYAIRTTPPDMLARYFTKEGSLYRIDPKLQQLVSFSQINLSDKIQLQKVERSQIVFCRNVIIYFDDEMKKSVINAYYDNLLPGGYLIIGHSESLHNISRAFKPEHHTGSIVYCKQN